MQAGKHVTVEKGREGFSGASRSDLGLLIVGRM